MMFEGFVEIYGSVVLILVIMERQIEKYPYRKPLYLQWYEAAIANLILFKCTTFLPRS